MSSHCDPPTVTAAVTGCDTEISYSLLNHPAVVFIADRLKDPQAAAEIHTLHVFDFDQTLFKSPLPSPALWDPSFLGQLISWNNCGPGWWHNPSTLDLGPEAEAARWSGWWNDDLVQKVKESFEDPGCLTMLLTGRNGPVFNQQLCQIVQGTGVQFDLMATKPTTVALINDSKETADNTKQTYLKIHTFCTKHDIIYHILFQYPSIQHMQVWDDRPQQIAKFREAGHDWLNSKMLKSFEVIAVEIPHKYLDPDREREMVLAMVDVHNQQVEVEQEGGPFMVAGIGPMPWTRPELEGKGIWNPYETYSPRKRSKIEMINAVQYTGIVFSKPVQALLQGIAIGAHKSHGQPLLELPSSLQDVELSKWVVSHDPHVLLCPGSAPQDYMTSLGGNGAAALVEVIAVGVLDGQIWALEVRPISLESLEADESTHSRIGIVTPNGDIHESIESFWNACAEDVKALSKQKYTVDLYHLANVSPQVPNSVLYITMAHDRFRGARPTDSAKITTWEPVRFSGPWERLILVGKIGKKHLLGMKSRHGQNAVIVRAEVSIANVIKGISSAGGKEPLGGKMLGEMIKKVQKEMEVLSIENKNDNREKITAIVDDLLNRPI